MPTVGDYGDPFPFEPYAPQHDAVTRIRRALQTQPHPTVVLESPTGTGKSHMLLASVLSDLFTPVYPSPSSVCAAGPTPLAASLQGTHGASLHAAHPTMCNDGDPLDSSRAPPTLQEVLWQHQLADEAARVKSERRDRVRAMRRRLRAARKRKALVLQAAGVAHGSLGKRTRDEGGDVHLTDQHEHDGGDDDAYVLDQHPLDFLEDAALDRLTAFTSSSSSSSSSRGSRDGASTDSDENGEGSGKDQETLLLRELATRVPLRKPKAYIASRTHTQIHQLFQDLLETDFVTYPIRTNSITATTTKTGVPPSSRAACAADAVGAHPLPEPRPLRAVHIGGRQQLCIHPGILRAAQGRTETLNDLCREAMRFEHSRAGRAARRAESRRHADGVRMAVDAVRDIEDLGVADSGAKGCAYCATSRLEALLRYVHDSATTRPYPMEAMKELGRTLGACPYLASRLLVRSADVVLAPYGYLADESLRNSLLAGVATNPVTEEEAAGVVGRQASDPPDAPPSLSSMLYQRRQRASAAYTNGKTRTPTTELTSESMEQGPNFTGDIVVLDEAHNLVDYCRSASTVAVTTRELTLVRQLLGAYLNRYESRLLSKNKQRLRELMLFTDKIIAYCDRKRHEHARACPRAQGGGESTGAMDESFTSFVFDAGIDHVDVFPFLVFLIDSRLAVKLLGLVPYVLQREAEQLRAAAERECARVRLEQLDRARRRQGRHTSSRVAQSREGDGEDSADGPVLPVSGAYAHPPESVLTHLFATLRVAPVKSTSPQPHTPSTTSAVQAIDVQAAVRATARAMQGFDALLRACVISEVGGAAGWGPRTESTTRVILQMEAEEEEEGEEAGESDGAQAVRATAGVVLRVVQLEPGQHTLGPVMQAAKGVVLAGGTMQPLALSCGLLLPPPPSTPAGAGVEGKQRETQGKLVLVSEPHVVPPSSITVWALPCGPSGRPLLFRHRDLHPTVAGGDDAILTELAMTLLNLVRVLPPAGVICFFPSYALERCFTEFLVARRLYAGIDAVKRIFREPAGGKGECRVEDMLAAYRQWISGSDTDSAVAGASRASTRSPRGALLFATMGGKLSEGINFADDLGRAVIVVGAPYANLADVELRLFLRHVAATRLSPTSAVSMEAMGGPDPAASVSAATLTREEWALYTDMCMRTVNQCIGRCIRHAGDYAAVILLDARYAQREEVRRRVSAWMQPSMRVAKNFGECFRGVRDFFAAKAAQQ